MLLESHITPPHSFHIGRSIPLIINIINILLNLIAGYQLSDRLY